MPEVWNRVFEICSDVPGDIQQFCDALWDISSPEEQLNLDHLPRSLESIFAHEFKGYETTLKVISGQQLKVLAGHGYCISDCKIFELKKIPLPQHLYECCCRQI